MATTTVTTLNQTVVDKYKITQIHKHIPSGQRDVYVVDANGKKVVIKIMALIATERLEREINICRSFSGKPGLPVFMSMELVEGKVVLIEEYIPGSALSDIVSTYIGDAGRVKLLLKHIINIMIPLWEKGLVHRDIKPENIIIKPNDTPTVIDFGIAKDFNADSVTEAGLQPHSPFYGAPEQYSGDKDFISLKTDLFSIGVLGFTLFYGTRPFGNTKAEIAQRFLNTSTPLNIPEDCPIRDFLQRCLHISSLERPRKPQTLLAHLA